MATLLEAIENTIHHSGLDPNSGILHLDRETLGCWIRRGDRDCARIVRELDRILQQIPNDLLKLGWISSDVMMFCVEIEREAKLLSINFCGAHLNDIINCSMRVDRFKLQLK